jgi:hypothetical protein
MSAQIISLDDHRRRVAYRVVVSEAGRAFTVSVDPAAREHPVCDFDNYGEALDYALAVQEHEGWPVFCLVREPAEVGS